MRFQPADVDRPQLVIGHANPLVGQDDVVLIGRDEEYFVWQELHRMPYLE